MEKERGYAKKNKYVSPIHETKEDCDRDFNNALKYCIQNIDDISKTRKKYYISSSFILWIIICFAEFLDRFLIWSMN